MKILIAESESYTDEIIRVYEELGDVIYGNSNWNTIYKSIKNCDVLVTKLKFVYSEEILKQCPKLKYIITSTTGENHIQVPLNRDISIISLKGEKDFLKKITPTAELTWGLVLSLSRMIPEAIKSVKDKSWNREPFISNELAGKNIGIIGYGRLGKIVTKYALAFNMNVYFYDNNPDVITDLDSNIKQSSLENLLEVSDFISIHIPYEKENINFIDKKALIRVKKTAYIINTSRGEVLDEDFLLQMIEEGKIAGAALDVLSKEFSGKADWILNSKILKSKELGKKILITPHIGGATRESINKTDIFVAKKFTNYINS